MRDTDIWKNVSDAEFDNAMEGMEKLVMNKLYELCGNKRMVADMYPLMQWTQHFHPSSRPRHPATPDNGRRP